MLYICTAIYLNIFVTTSISTSIYLYLHYIKYINLIKKYKIKESKKKKMHLLYKGVDSQLQKVV